MHMIKNMQIKGKYINKLYADTKYRAIFAIYV